MEKKIQILRTGRKGGTAAENVEPQPPWATTSDTTSSVE